MAKYKISFKKSVGKDFKNIPKKRRTQNTSKDRKSS